MAGLGENDLRKNEVFLLVLRRPRNAEDTSDEEAEY